MLGFTNRKLSKIKSLDRIMLKPIAYHSQKFRDSNDRSKK